jgi:hypothetical protein
VMVQPYQAAVDEAGETALLSSAASTATPRARRRCWCRAGRPERRGDQPAAGHAAELAVARAALAACRGRSRCSTRGSTSCRGPDGAPVLMELEVTEPCLFLRRRRRRRSASPPRCARSSRGAAPSAPSRRAPRPPRRSRRGRPCRSVSSSVRPRGRPARW